MALCGNTPLVGPHYLNLLNHSDRLVVSLISGQGYFTFLYQHTKHNIHNREVGRKRNKQTRTWVSSKRKKGEVCDTFLAFCVLSRACIRAKFRQIHQEPLGPHILAVGFPRLLLTTLSCRLPCPADCPVLFSRGPSFPRPLPVSWEISRTSPLCGFRAKTDWHLPTPTETNATHRVTFVIK